MWRCSRITVSSTRGPVLLGSSMLRLEVAHVEPCYLAPEVLAPLCKVDMILNCCVGVKESLLHHRMTACVSVESVAQECYVTRAGWTPPSAVTYIQAQGFSQACMSDDLRPEEDIKAFPTEHGR